MQNSALMSWLKLRDKSAIDWKRIFKKYIPHDVNKYALFNILSYNLSDSFLLHSAWVTIWQV